MTFLARYRYSNCRREEPRFRIFRFTRGYKTPAGDPENRTGSGRHEPIRPPEPRWLSKRQWPGYSNLIWDVELKLIFGPIDPPDIRWIKPESGVISWY